MNLRSLIAAVAVAALAAAALPAHAVTTVQWDFETATAPTPATGTTWTGIASSTGTGIASVVHNAPATTFSTPSGNGSLKSISSNTWTVGDYYQFAFSMTGYTALNLSFDQTGSGTGPRDFSVAYSTDGINFLTASSYAVPVSTWNTTTVMSGFTQAVNLSSFTALNNASTVYIRLIDATTTSISGGTTATGGTDRVDNFSVNVTAAVPEPETYALMFAGLGVVGFMAKRRKA